jgi:hypothetical protein
MEEAETIKDYLDSDNGSKPEHHRQPVWWAYAIYQGKLVIDGWYYTEMECYTFAAKNIPCRFEVISLDTINRASATQKIKHQILDETGDIDFALKRAKHKL